MFVTVIGHCNPLSAVITAVLCGIDIYHRNPLSAINLAAIAAGHAARRQVVQGRCQPVQVRLLHLPRARRAAQGAGDAAGAGGRRLARAAPAAAQRCEPWLLPGGDPPRLLVTSVRDWCVFTCTVVTCTVVTVVTCTVVTTNSCDVSVNSRLWHCGAACLAAVAEWRVTIASVTAVGDAFFIAVFARYASPA